VVVTHNPHKNVDGKLFVDGFMSHINGLEILAITEEAYNENQNPQKHI